MIRTKAEALAAFEACIDNRRYGIPDPEGERLLRAGIIRVIEGNAGYVRAVDAQKVLRCIEENDDPELIELLAGRVRASLSED